MRRLAAAFAALSLLGAGVAGCGGGDGDEEAAAEDTAAGCEEVAAPAAKPDGGQEPPAEPLAAGDTYELTFETSCGDFTVTLDPASAPITTASLVQLARNGFYDDTVVHRIVPSFVVQAGDPTGTGTGGPGYSTVDPPPSDARYTKGVVAMAKTATDPAGTSGSQFFVVTADDAALPPEYAIVGSVTAGEDTLERLDALGTEEQVPSQVVVIRKATVRGP